MTIYLKTSPHSICKPFRPMMHVSDSHAENIHHNNEEEWPEPPSLTPSNLRLTTVCTFVSRLCSCRAAYLHHLPCELRVSRLCFSVKLWCIIFFIEFFSLSFSFSFSLTFCSLSQVHSHSLWVKNILACSFLFSFSPS